MARTITEDDILEGEDILNRPPSKGKIHRFKERQKKTICGTAGDVNMVATISRRI
jgi:hypothetical protein